MQDLPDSRGVLVYILLADLLNTVITEVISLTSQHDQDRTVAAAGALFSFLFSLVIFFGSLVTIDVIIHSCKKTSANVKLRTCLVLAQCMGAILYFFGNNSADIFGSYSKELNCDESCVVMWRIAAMISLGSALAYYQLIPPCLHRIAKLYQYEDKRSDWFSSTAMIAIFIKIDALFNTVNLASEKTGDGCGTFPVALTTIFLLVCTALGIGLMTSNFVYSMVTLRRNQNINEYNANEKIFITSFVILSLCFPPYLLTDNEQPLDCAFECQGNSNSNGSNFCYSTGSSGLRLGLSSLMFMVIIFVSILLFLYKHRMTRKEMESNLMYAKFN